MPGLPQVIQVTIGQRNFGDMDNSSDEEMLGCTPQNMLHVFFTAPCLSYKRCRDEILKSERIQRDVPCMSKRLQLRTLPPYPVAKPSVGVHVSKDLGSTKTDEPTRDIYIYTQLYTHVIFSIQISHTVVFLRGAHFTTIGQPLRQICEMNDVNAHLPSQAGSFSCTRGVSGVKKLSMSDSSLANNIHFLSLLAVQQI